MPGRSGVPSVRNRLWAAAPAVKNATSASTAIDSTWSRLKSGITQSIAVLTPYTVSSASIRRLPDRSEKDVRNADRKDFFELGFGADIRVVEYYPLEINAEPTVNLHGHEVLPEQIWAFRLIERSKQS